MPRKPKRPPHVILKFDHWHVRRYFPTTQRDSQNRIIYEQIVRRCVPETPERAAEISQEIEYEYSRIQSNQTVDATVCEFFDKFLDTKRINIRQRSFEDYEFLKRRYLDSSTFGRRPVADIKSKDVQAFYMELMKSGVSGQMIRKLHVLLRMGFKRAVLWDEIDESPVTDIILPLVNRRERTPFTEIQAVRFIGLCQVLAFHFVLETGLRPQEYCALTWKDIDLNHCTVRIVRAIEWHRNETYEFKDPKTLTSRRTVDFSPAMRDKLIEHKNSQKEMLDRLRMELDKPILLSHMKRKGVNFKKRDGRQKQVRQILENFASFDLVFPNKLGTVMSRSNLNRRYFTPALIKAGLDPAVFSLNSLRHTHASIMATKIPPKQLQARMGHSSIVTTLTYYIHVINEQEMRPSHFMADLLYKKEKSNVLRMK